MPAPVADRRSFEEEALPHLDGLYRVALRLTRDPARAEDLVQETMLRAFRAWDRFTPGTNARAWLFAILRNGFINEYRRMRREPRMVELDAAEPGSIHDAVADTDPEGRFFSRIVDEQVLAALDDLPPDFREVVVLSDVEGLPYAEIAELLGVPVGTVKSRLFRARRLLQRALYDYAVEMGYLEEPRGTP
ncbi:MAG TPA: sigma-70 family RNA polymerase sigma factor [Gemmatimonadales bacterium]|nr:sigma-70 family RNA polymerase sigma factor [Gemmatimonadales bacterium]